MNDIFTVRISFFLTNLKSKGKRRKKKKQRKEKGEKIQFQFNTFSLFVQPKSLIFGKTNLQINSN